MPPARNPRPTTTAAAGRQAATANATSGDGLTRGQKAAETRRRNRERAEEAARALNEQRSPTAHTSGTPATAGDDAPVTAGHLRQALEGLQAAVSANDDIVEDVSARMNAIDAKLDALIASASPAPLQVGAAGPSTAQAPALALPNPAPIRGQYGECPPITKRYGYIDEKLRGEAMMGTMAPEKLPQLLPLKSALAVRLPDDEDTFEINGVTVNKKKTTDQAAVLARFVRGIPKASTFSAAWAIYTDLILHGMGAYDAKTVADAHSALRSHETWILEHAEKFTWESVMSYHLTVCNERREGFHCSQWYKNFDGDSWGSIGVRKDATRPLPTTTLRRPPTDPESTPQAGASTQSRPKTRACVNWNAGLCPGKTCPNGYRHCCKKCSAADHVARDCPKLK